MKGMAVAKTALVRSMKDIRVARTKSGAFQLSIDGTEYDLSAAELKVMLLRVVEAFGGTAGGGGSAAARKGQQAFFRRLMEANDPGIQSLLRQAGHEDVLVVLKVNEGDDAFRAKFFRNMSANMQKMFREDLNYKFKEPPPDSKVAAAVARLRKVCDALEREELMEYS